MKSTFKYPLFLFITLLFVGCVPSTQKDKKDPPKKIEYKGALKYFKDKYGQEIYEPINQNNGFYITLPECFEFDLYSAISLTGLYTYYCNSNSTYFSIDHITKEDVSYYRDYFESKNIRAQDDLHILRDYVMEIRTTGLVDAKMSVLSTIKTHKGDEMLLGTVVGQIGIDADELSYQYGVVTAGGEYYVLQAIASVDNYKYLRQDILEIFKSFRAR